MTAVAEDLDAVAVGDTVRVSDGSRRTTDGTVVKVGRTLVHVDNGHGRITTYHRAGFRRRDGYPGGFRTLARVADDEARVNAAERAGAHGITVDYGTRGGWSTAQLVTLAEAIERIAAEA